MSEFYRNSLIGQNIKAGVRRNNLDLATAEFNDNGELEVEMRLVLREVDNLTPETAELSLGDGNAEVELVADTAGAAGNEISVEFIDPEEDDQDLSVEVDDKKISVYLGTDGSGDIDSTADDVVAEINAHDVAGDLVTASDGDGDGSDEVEAHDEEHLDGGVDGAEAMENELVVYDDKLHISTDESTVSDSNFEEIADWS